MNQWHFSEVDARGLVADLCVNHFFKEINMLFRSWLRGLSSRPARRSVRRQAIRIESCETRVMLTISSTFAGGVLTVASSGADTITLGADLNGNVTLNGGTLSANVGGSNASVSAANVTSLVINGGTGNNAINLSGVTAASFTSLTQVSVHGGNGNDTITGSDFAELITGDNGNDRIIGNGGADTCTGGTGNDRISGNVGDDSIDGGVGNDSLSGEEGNDEIIGGDGNDTASGGVGDDEISGGIGNDSGGWLAFLPIPQIRRGSFDFRRSSNCAARLSKKTCCSFIAGVPKTSPTSPAFANTNKETMRSKSLNSTHLSQKLKVKSPPY